MELWLPPTLDVLDGPPAAEPDPLVRVPGSGGPIELDRPVPSGNMALCGNQFWLGPARAGQVAVLDRLRLGAPVDRWAADQVLRSRFSVNDLDTLIAQGASGAAAAGVAARSRIPGRSHDRGSRAHRGPQRDRVLGQRTVLAAEILAGRRVGIYIEEGCPLLFFDLETRELLRTRPNPLEPAEATRLQRCRPVGSAEALDRTDHRATPRLEHRGDHGRRPEDRPRP